MPRELADPLAEALSVFDGRPAEPLTASEVAGALGTGREGATDRLLTLERRGMLASKQVGGDDLVWWRPGGRSAGAGLADALDAADAGVVLVAADHEVVWANDRVLEYLGLAREAVVGTDAREFVTRRLRNVVADPEAFAEAVLDAHDEATPEPVAFRVLPDEGVDARWLELRSRPVETGPLAGGRVDVYYEVAGYEVTEREAGRRTLERDRRFQRRREQLEVLDDLNAVLRGVTDAVVAQSTRDEIEATVCETLAASDAYLFAWVAGVDAATGDVEVRASAGAGADEYLERVDVSSDPDDPTGQGPTGRAIRTGELQVVRDVAEEETYEPWRETAREHGVRASAAIPITHEGTPYGVVNVYTDREDAFADEERDVVGQLGGVVGHAIAAVERKQALMGDEVVEVEFAVHDAFERLDPADRPGGIVEIDRVVPVGDDTYLVYGTITGEDVDALEAVVGALPHWESVTTLDKWDDRDRFELRLSEPPMLSTIAARGGQIREARIEDGDMHLTVHLPPTVDVRGITEVVQDVHPDAELVTRRQVARDTTARERLEHVLDEEVTDHQRGALEAAFHAGFFEWPRDASGEDVADALGVTAPTFHQHVRAAERKLLAALFEEATTG